eukprot:gnl/TRDRNA2_/TRDRNA2_88719_c0_seq1.p1 gnl/TRDRNA2_/TRDRNA2_88719_c0~~gnl/TRDRNA2_/TRDRNA2_88719_c0_seq1.p1  ORF type:complete len:574 (+),score=78.82 gnl/TRDRNA2_/TRDRNA2_88719_c0_seq1:63-1784(+)
MNSWDRPASAGPSRLEAASPRRCLLHIFAFVSCSLLLGLGLAIRARLPVACADFFLCWQHVAVTQECDRCWLQSPIGVTAARRLYLKKGTGTERISEKGRATREASLVDRDDPMIGSPEGPAAGSPPGFARERERNRRWSESSAASPSVALGGQERRRSDGGGESAAVAPFPVVRLCSVHVCVRMRPRTQSEIGGRDCEAAWQLDGAAGRVAVPIGGKGNMPWSGDGFTAVLGPDKNNADLFESIDGRLMPLVAAGGMAAVFAYGHTSSGKTHSLLGYDKEDGLYRLAASWLCENLPPGCVLAVRFYEMHNKRVFDLLDGRTECHVRENSDGTVHVRGPAVKDDAGRVTVHPLKCILARTVGEVAAAVSSGIQLRRVGSSSLHTESSRSHAMLEFEIVTEEVMAARSAVIEAEGDLVGAQSDLVSKRTFRARKEVERLEKLLEVLRANVTRFESQGPVGCCGALVVGDLAGAECGNAGAGLVQTTKEKNEAREIHLSLFALNECLRAIVEQSRTGRAKRIPFRSSPLTMVLRRHLLGNQSATAMIITISPTESQAKQSVTSLQYGAMVAKAGA